MGCGAGEILLSGKAINSRNFFLTLSPYLRALIQPTIPGTRRWRNFAIPLKFFMAYQYDVFISYKSESKDWVLKAFLPLFERHLQEALGGRKPSIFMDMQRIENGDAWRNTLRYALAHSRCVVAVLTPSYFHSEWCTKELSVMLHRAKQHGLLTKEIPGGLIAPLCVSG